MKYIYHVPTENYGFVEVEKEMGDLQEPPSYDDVKASVVPQNAPGDTIGVPNKEWLGIVETYLLTSELQGGAETWEKLNKYQKDWIQETKRAMKRLQAKEDKEIDTNVPEDINYDK